MINISDVAKGWIIKSVFALLCVGAVFANMQIMKAKDNKIEDLSKDIKTMNAKISDLEAQKAQIQAEMIKKDQSDGVTEQKRTEVRAAEAKVEKAKTDANKYVEKKLSEIEAKYNKLPQDAANLERKRIEVSLERAKGLWMTYCLQEPEEQACK